MNFQNFRSGLIYLLLLVALGVFIYSSIDSRTATAQVTIPIAEVADLVKQGEVEKLDVRNDQITVFYKDGRDSSLSRKEQQTGLIEILTNFGVSSEQLNNVVVNVPPPTLWEGWSNVLFAILPLILLGIFFFFILRQAQGAGNQAFGFGKSRARMFTGDTPTITFEDVAGNDEAKQDLHEIVEFLQEPEKFASLGARIPKGVLLVGPPGTGKTLMAQAVSGEAGVPFFNISGSEFVEMFVGVGASRVRDLFGQAKKNSPCIVFVDEIDAVGRHRGAGMGGSHDEREQTLNQILVEMDGFDTDTNVIMVAATNRPDVLDPALLRPGRFDRRVTMDEPDVKGRAAILDVHVRGKPLAENVDLHVIAKQTPGFAGADLENLVNEAAILAARRDRRSIGMDELQESIARVMMGPERRSRMITPKEKEIVAYHEAGHAVAAYALPNHDPVHKVTIVPRGMSGGMTWILPDSESQHFTKSKMISQLVAALGGRVAEEIRFGDVTTGASGDLEKVTNLARAMVTKWGMSEQLGPIRYGESEEMMFLNQQTSERRNYSDKLAQAIDAEVQDLIEGAHQRCHEVLQANWDKLETVSEYLMDVETLEASEFEAIMRGEDPFEMGNKPSPPQAKPIPSEPSNQRQATEERGGLDLGDSLPAPA